MNWMINEVQITCIILMTLSTIVLGIVIPYYANEEILVRRARKGLTVGTFLVAVHFIMQYYMHKFDTISPINRSLINLTFAIPIGFCFNFALLYMQRKGQIKRGEYLYIAVAFILNLLVLGAAIIPGLELLDRGTAAFIMSVSYASTLYLYYYLQFKEYLRIKKDIREKTDLSQISLQKWSTIPMFLMFVVGLSLPIMTFNNEIWARSLCGLISISISFLFISCFIGYDLTIFTEPQIQPLPNVKGPATRNEETNDVPEKLDEEKMQKMHMIAHKLIESKYYLNSGITLKDVADEMGVSRSTLHAWLLTTKHKKFNNWLMHLRIEEAKQMLINHPNWSNETIAKACGFCDRSYFQRQFSDIVGTTPSKWAKDRQAENNSQEA